MTIQVQQKQQQSIPEILRMKECSNLIGQEQLKNLRAGIFLNKQFLQNFKKHKDFHFI